jgi:rfaE bifunctional protein kinase chain/domain
VVVVGDAMLDRYLEGAIERDSPEAPVPVVRVKSERVGLGGAANVAANLAALGAIPLLIGARGSDRDGELLHRELRGLGLDDRGLLELDDRPTTVKTRVLARGRQVIRIDDEADHPISPGALELARARLREALPGAHAVILEDYDKGMLEPDLIAAAIGGAGELGIPVLVDPKTRGFFRYAGATVFKPNLREAALGLGQPVDPDHPEALLALYDRLQACHLLLTMGAHGMHLVSEDRVPVHVPALPRVDPDVSGAGDTVSAAVTLALSAGATMLEAAWIGTLAASVEVGKAGVSVVMPPEILAERERV